MKRLVKLLLGMFAIVMMMSSCEKGCICRNVDTGAAEELYGVYSKKDCAAYTEYYQSISHQNNVECTMEWK